MLRLVLGRDPFAKAATLDLTRGPWRTSMPELDAYLETPLRAFYEVSTSRERSRAEILEAVPTLAPLDRLSDEDFGRAQAIMRILGRRSLNRTYGSEPLERMDGCSTQFWALVQSAPRGTISEGEAVALISRHGVLDLDLLERSFPQGAPNSLSGPLDRFAKRLSNSNWRTLERLETFVGHDPAENPLLREVRRQIALIDDAYRALHVQLGPVWRDLLKAIRDTPGDLSARQHATFAERVAALDPKCLNQNEGGVFKVLRGVG